mgnify:CR=1 FL=1
MTAKTLPQAERDGRIGLRLKDIARLLGISERGAYYLRARGGVPPPDRMLGRLPIWHRRTVERWLSAEGRA